MTYSTACCASIDDPRRPCPGNGDPDVAAPPNHLCLEPLYYPRTEHDTPHICDCGYRWPYAYVRPPWVQTTPVYQFRLRDLWQQLWKWGR